MAPVVKNLPANAGDIREVDSRKKKERIQSLGRKDALEEGMATHSSMFAWRIPRTEEPGGIQSTGSHSVEHGWRDSAQHKDIFAYDKGKWQKW